MGHLCPTRFQGVPGVGQTTQRLARPEVAWEAATVIQSLIEQLGRGGESVLVVLPGLESILLSIRKINEEIIHNIFPI